MNNPSKVFAFFRKKAASRSFLKANNLLISTGPLPNPLIPRGGASWRSCA